MTKPTFIKARTVFTGFSLLSFLIATLGVLGLYLTGHSSDALVPQWLTAAILAGPLYGILALMCHVKAPPRTVKD